MRFRTNIIKRLLIRILIFGTILNCSWVTYAQDTEAKDSTVLTPQVLKGNEIGDYDLKTRQLITDVRSLMENRPELASIRISILEIDSLTLEDVNILRDTSNVFSLDQLDRFENELGVYNNKIDPWIQTIEEWREDTDQFKEEIDFDLKVWNLTSDSVQTAKRRLLAVDTISRGTLNRIQEQLEYNISSLTLLKNDFAIWERELLDTENNITVARSALNDISGMISRRKQNFIYNIWIPEYPPIWEKGEPVIYEGYLEEIIKNYREAIDRGTKYFRTNKMFYTRMLFGLILLIVLIFYMRKRVGDLFQANPEIEVEDNFVLKNPVVSAFVIFIYVCFIFFDIPSQVKYLIVFLSIIPVTFMLWRQNSEYKTRHIIFFIAFAIIFITISIFNEPSRPMRYTLILIDLLCIYFLLGLRKDKDLVSRENKYWLGTLPSLIPIFLIFAVLAIIANVIGSVQLSLVLTRTILGTFLAYVVIKESVNLVQSFLYLLIVGPLFKVSNIVKEDSQRILSWLGKATRIASYLYWIYLVTGFLRIRDPLLNGIKDFVNTPLEIGEVSIALADVLAFYIIMQISIWISRFIRYILDKEVFPRTHTEKGVASTISVMIRYTFTFIGFILALAAAGVNLDQVVVGLSALGIGIGFGLQNIVNNFVSGIILALERPISIGDVVKVDDTEGVVRDIGLRASQIRTWNGADVLVPNGSLISGKLLNWTLDDRARRLNVDIRLPLDADIEKALPIVLNAAKSVKELSKEPAPAVNYEGHHNGHSVIRVYGWIADISSFFSAGTAFRVTVFEALKKEGFEISMPVIDVHMDQSPGNTTSSPDS